MISRKYKFHVLKRKIADFFEPSEILFGQIQVMLILTLFWVRKQYCPIPNTEIMLTLEDAFNLQFVGYCPGAFCTL